MYYRSVVNGRNGSGYVALELYSLAHVGLSPLVLHLAALGHDGTELGGTVGIELLDLLADYPGILRVAAKVADGHRIVGARFAQGLSMGAALAFEV